MAQTPNRNIIKVWVHAPTHAQRCWLVAGRHYPAKSLICECPRATGSHAMACPHSEVVLRQGYLVELEVKGFP